VPNIPPPGRKSNVPPPPTWTEIEPGVYRGVVGRAGDTNCITITLTEYFLAAAWTAPLTEAHRAKMIEKITEVLSASPNSD
jgi:hypothetical protein